MRTGYGVAALVAIVFTFAPATRADWHQTAAGKTPQQAVDELLAADRAFSKASALPAAMVEPTTDPAAIERHRQSLDAVERAFSEEAQKIGIGTAFAKYGSPDAVNAGGPNEGSFLVGSAMIGQSVGAGSPGGSPVSWGPDSVLVASSGDLGVTFGMIRSNAPGRDGNIPSPIPFFTVWRRASANDPWKYIAE